MFIKHSLKIIAETKMLPAHTFMEKFPSSTDSRRESCQLLAKEWAPNTGKLPLVGLPRKSVVK